MTKIPEHCDPADIAADIFVREDTPTMKMTKRRRRTTTITRTMKKTMTKATRSKHPPSDTV
jgi:hypothetical protein